MDALPLHDGAARAPLRTLRLDVAYRGDAFHGWQRQPGLRTVQGEVEAVLERLLGAPHTLVSCGRTDAGAHARQHVTSLRTHNPLPIEALASALDALLPDDVGVVALRDMPMSFHAQRDAVWKWYRYRVLVSRHRQPLVDARAWRRATTPSLERLVAATAPLLGRHDFTSFANSGSTPGRTKVRTLHALVWREGWADGDEGLDDGGGEPGGSVRAERSPVRGVPDPVRGVPWLALDVLGDGFLYKMVRTIVGTVFAAAQDDDPPARVREVLAARDRRCAGIAVPAAGLTLMAVGVAPQAGAAPAEAPRPAGMPADLARALDSLGHTAAALESRAPEAPVPGPDAPTSGRQDDAPSPAAPAAPAPGARGGRRATALEQE